MHHEKNGDFGKHNFDHYSVSTKAVDLICFPIEYTLAVQLKH